MYTYVKRILIVLIAILIVINVIVSITSPFDKISSANFEGKTTSSIFNGKLNFVISNGDSSDNKILWIYGLNNSERYNISASDLVDDNSGLKIEHLQVTFEPALIKDITKTVKKVKVNIDYVGKPAGEYQGNIIIDEDKAGGIQSLIPFTFDLKPNTVEVIIWVMDGIAISIVLWKVIIYHSHRHSYNSINEGLSKDRNKWKEFVSNNPSMAQQYLKVNPDLNPNVPLTLKKYVETSATREKLVNEFIRIGGTVLFGIGVSVLGLLNNPYIIGLHNIGLIEVLALIGIGLGIGSLKDIAEKIT